MTREYRAVKSKKKSIIVDAGVLRVGFHWHTDRFAHSIGIVDDERLTPLMATVEGGGSDSWPPSPPIQSVHTERRGNSTILLLLGVAGHSHWSASICLDSEWQSADFDVACRIKSVENSNSTTGLGTQYRTMTGPAAGDAEELHICVDGRGVRVDVNTAAGAARSELELSADRLLIKPHSRLDNPPDTIRWRYKITALTST